MQTENCRSGSKVVLEIMSVRVVVDGNYSGFQLDQLELDIEF
jgi:hypothetical protein